MQKRVDKIIAIVPAAGVGSRMQADRPKQYLEIQGKTVLEHSLNVLLDYPPIAKVIVAVSKDDPYVESLSFLHREEIELVHGGDSRAESVFNGLKQIQDAENTWVLVHDAARPCLTHQDLDQLIRVVDEHGAILAVPVVETVKKMTIDRRILATEDRSYFWLAQTPQFFRADLLKKGLAFALERNLQVTDDASAMELIGFQPHLVTGRRDNIKITHPEDLALAEFYLAKKLTKI